VKRLINPEDGFKVNTNFSSVQKKIVINSLQKKESKQEAEVVHEKVIMERKFIIEAAVVRTMKARQTLQHNDLVTEVIRLVRFPLDISVLK
jgi:FAD synthase